VDERLRAWLAGFRDVKGPARQAVVALTTDAAGAQIVALGQHNLWLWCTTAIALTGELLLCAQHGGIFSEEVEGQWDLPARINVRTLRLLRNATCHPAHQANVGSGTPPIERLVTHLRNTEREESPLAIELERSWSLLADRRVAEFALRKLDAAGRAFAARFGIPIPR
jgi:hypothetical protein